MTFQELLDRARMFQDSRVLLTALELDIFSAVGGGASSGEVARKAGTDARATAMLLNALVSLGALEKRGGRFFNTSDIGRFLSSASPENEQPGLMHMVNQWHTWTTLTDAVRKGTSVNTPGVDARNANWTEAFISAMHRIAGSSARAVLDAVREFHPRTMVDVGGGSGAYSIAFAQAYPDLRATVFDRDNVLPITQRHIRSAGLEDRVITRAGDLRTDDFGGPYDLVLVSAICHMLDEAGNQDLLKRCFRATSPGGCIIVRDFIVEEERTSPKVAALFALNMLVGTEAGSTYTESEYRAWLTEAGYTDVRRIPVPGGQELITAVSPSR